MIDKLIVIGVFGFFALEGFLCWCLCKAEGRNRKEMEELDEQRRL